ncbi:MAG: sel1 repeat family protein [Clostridiales bacterium]|nr:sel1 repeat family protein [Clostridiales bacterium]
MEEKERSFYDKFKDVVNAYMFHDPNAQAATAFDRERRKKTVDEKSFQMFRESAEAGHPFACFSLGRCYENGMGVEKDLEKAYEWYRKAAAAGDVNAWLALGKFFDTGTYVERDPKEAAMWLERAAAKDHPIAMIGLGQKYVRGEGVERDHAKALELFTAAHEKDKKIGSYVLGEAIADGIGCKKDYQKAAELMKESHDNGLALGTFNFGMMLEMGLGCEKDEQKGFELIKNAADEGIPDAMYRIAFHYREGSPQANKDVATAFSYFKQAADKGFPLACVETGLCYENGTGVKMSKEEAFRYYEKGTQLGHHVAMVCLAVCYLSGIGCEKDRSKSMSLLEQAVRIGNTRAYHLLGILLMEDDPYDERAINLLMVAAKAGFARSALSLGSFFLREGEIPSDKDKAKHYFRLAADQGNSDAKFELAELLNTDENKDNEDVQTQIKRLYFESADAGHPLAAYKAAIALKEEDGDDPAQIRRKQIHYMCIASSGGVPEAAGEIAERCFWGDGLRMDIHTACGLYHYAADSFSSKSLQARFAFCQVLISLENFYFEIGMYVDSAKKTDEEQRKNIVRSDEKYLEGMKILSELAEEKVEDAMIFLPLAKALSEGENADLSSGEDHNLLSFLDELPEKREKYYVQGLLSAILNPEDIHGSIRFLRYARAELQACNVDQILGNLYYSLSRKKRKERRGEIRILKQDMANSWNKPLRMQDDLQKMKDNSLYGSRRHIWEEEDPWKTTSKPSRQELVNTAAEMYLEAYRAGQRNDPSMCYACCEELMRLNFRFAVRTICIYTPLILALVAVLIFFARNAQSTYSGEYVKYSTYSDIPALLGKTAMWGIPAAIILIVLLKIHVEYVMYENRKKLDPQVKK